MQKQFIIWICLIITLIGCSGGGSSGSDPILPSQDLTGEYEMEVNLSDISCSSDIDFSICVECRKIADELYNRYNEVNVIIDQYGNNFDFIINDEIYTGTINLYDEYSFSDKEFITQDGVIIRIEWRTYFRPITITEGKYGISGNFTYNIWHENEFLCGFSMRFEGYSIGSRDPIIYIDPIEYDYGTVEYNGKKTAKFTIYNANPDHIAKDLVITAKEQINDDTQPFYIDPLQIIEDNHIRYNQPFTFSIVYEPKSWPVEDFYTLTLITNDPDYPEINIELKGKGTDVFPQVSVSGDLTDCSDNYNPPITLGCVEFETPIQVYNESDKKAVVITNVGSIDLDLTIEYRIQGFYIYYNNELLTEENFEDKRYFTLMPNESIEFNVSFYPEASNDPSWNDFSFLSNDPNHKDFRIVLIGHAY